MGSTSEELIAEGDRLLHEDRLDEAEARYASALALDPRSAEALYSIGCVCSRRGEHADAEEFATRATTVDPDHRGAQFLRANSRYAAGDYAGAVAIFERARVNDSDLPALTQMGLALEQLGRLADAESALRRVLEHDSSYITRFHAMAMHSKNPFFADVHHALARVLQRMGNTKDAHMHYHLAKRVDPKLELDPMYRQILSEHDLENHPYFDVHEPEPASRDAPLPERINDLLRQPTYAALVERARALGVAADIDDIAHLIQAAQKLNNMILAARFRLVGDVADGADGQALFRGLRTLGWRQLFELAEAYAKNQRDRNEVELLAARIGIERDTIDTLIALTKRFIRLEPESAQFLTFPTRVALIAVGDDESLAAGWYLDGICAVANRRWLVGEEMLQRSVETIAITDRHPFAGEAFEELVRAHRMLKRQAATISSAERYLALAQGRSPFDEARAHALLAQAVAAAGDRARATHHVRSALELAETASVPPRLVEQLRDFLAWLQGIPVAEKDDVEHAVERARTLIERGDIVSGLAVLDEAYQRALDAVDHHSVIEILAARGDLLDKLGRLDEAYEAHEHALGRARPITHRVDIWELLMRLSSLADRRGKRADALAHAEEALREAERTDQQPRAGATHRWLAALLVDDHPERAIDHVGRSLEHGGPTPDNDEDDDTPPDDAQHPAADQDAREILQVARLLMQQRSFADAAVLFEQLLAQPGPDDDGTSWALAATNLATCRFLLGAHEDALALVTEAARRLEEGGDRERACDVTLRRVRFLQELGRSIDEELRHAYALIQRFDSLGLRREKLIEVAERAIEGGAFQLCEQLTDEALAIMVDPNWRDLRDEMTCHALHGRTWRTTARYEDALGAYQRAFERADALGDQDYRGLLHGWRAIVYRYMHDLDKARQDYVAAIAIAEQAGDFRNVAQHRFNMIPLLTDLGEDHEAYRNAQLVLQITSHEGPETLRRRTLMVLHSYFRDRLDEVITREIDALLDIAPTAGDHVVVAWALTVVADRRIREGAANEAHDLLERAIAIHRGAGDRYNEAAALLNRARSIGHLDRERAANDIARAREVAVEIEHRKLVVECDEELLKLALQRGDPALTRRQLERLVPAWPILRRGLESDQARIHYAKEVSELAETCGWFFVDDDPIRAFEMFELSRAQATSDLLMRGASSDFSAGDTFFDLEGICTVLAGLPRKNVALTLNVVGDDVVAMSYRAGDSAPQRRACAMTRSELDTLLSCFHDEMHALGGRGAISWPQLAAPLIAGFDAVIEDGDLVVLIVDELLQGLPFACVPLGSGLLVDRATPLYCPGLTVLRDLAARRVRRPRTGRLTTASIGIAFPDEALAVNDVTTGRALTGNALSKEVIAEHFKNCEIIHFSGHGRFDRDAPLESGLEIRTPRSEFLGDILSVRDLSKWDISCGLVTLSACETGLGDIAASEFMGLGRNLLAAGADAVLATLWRVSRHTTLDFMVAFYQEIERRHRHDPNYLDLAECLHATQQVFQTKFPIHGWAGFKLIGWPWIRHPAQGEPSNER